MPRFDVAVGNAYLRILKIVGINKNFKRWHELKDGRIGVARFLGKPHFAKVFFSLGSARCFISAESRIE